ncbi:MAG: ATP-binding cassette domain-containing protein, partial [Dehalococcoidia bacterium]
MPKLQVSGISKSFGAVTAVDDAWLTAEAGELVCLLGPSGCGKTTLLRLIAGLETADAGSIAFDGQDLDGLTPRERGFGLMFQDLALFPHMDVSGNVSFGLRMQHL